MPYKIVGSHVVRADTGKQMNKKPLSRARLKRYIIALRMHSPEAQAAHKAFEGHRGRPGKVGGSLPRTASGVLKTANVFGARTAALKNATNGIDQVHSVEGIKPVKFYESAKLAATKGVQGGYNPTKRYIVVNSKGNYKALTATHEFGHVLEKEAFKSPKLQVKVKAIYNAMDNTRGVKMLKRGKITKTFDFNGKRYVVGGNIFGYYLRRDEMFARGYAQYIASKSKNRSLKQDLSRRRHMILNGQWDDGDFAQVSKAYDDLFKEAGWNK